MDEERGFLAALEAAPNDDSSWLVYADWLEEQADERAEFLRLAAMLSCGMVEPGCAKATAERLSELREALPAEWMARCDRLRAARSLRFRITTTRSAFAPWAGTQAWGVLESGTIRTWDGVAILLEADVAHDWVQRVCAGGEDVPATSAGQGPAEIRLELSNKWPAALSSATILSSPQADAELRRRLSLNVDELNLSIRARNRARRLGCTTVGDLATLTEEEALEGGGFSSNTLQEYRDKLRALRLGLGMQRFRSA